MVQLMLTGYEVTNVDAEHIAMTVDGQIVLMRKQDRTINATQILKLTHKSSDARRKKLDSLRRENEYEIRPFRRRPNTWISIQRGKQLCVELKLEEKLRPLLDHGFDLQGHQSNLGIEKVCDRHSGLKLRALRAKEPSKPDKVGEVGDFTPSLTGRDAIYADRFRGEHNRSGIRRNDGGRSSCSHVGK